MWNMTWLLSEKVSRCCQHWNITEIEIRLDFIVMRGSICGLQLGYVSSLSLGK